MIRSRGRSEVRTQAVVARLGASLVEAAPPVRAGLVVAPSTTLSRRAEKPIRPPAWIIVTDAIKRNETGCCVRG